MPTLFPHLNSPLFAYDVLMFLVTLQRLGELFLSRKNEKNLKAQGAREMNPEHFPFMAMVHLFWLVSCVVEAHIRETPPPLGLSLVFLLVFFLGQSLRFLAIKTLGPRWTVRILVLPEAPLVETGIYRYLRHPNYWGVILEIFSLPLVYGLWATSLVFGVLNLLVLAVRIQKEEKALGL